MQLAEQQSDLAAYRNLVNSVGWGRLVNYLRLQRNTRCQEILLKPIKASAELYEQEYLKGEAAMLLAVERMPEMLMEIADAQQTYYQAILRENDNERTGDTGDDAEPIGGRSAP